MASEIISSVGSDAGDDYSDIAAWWADKKGNIVSADQVQIAELRGEVHDAGASITLTMSAGDATTDSTRYYHIRTMSGADFKGDFDDLGSVARLTQNDDVHNFVMFSNVPYTRLEGFVLEGVNNVAQISSAALKVEDDTILVDSIGIHDFSVTSTQNGTMNGLSGAGTFRNCVINNIAANISGSGDSKTCTARGIYGYYASDKIPTIYNCTVGNIVAASTNTSAETLAFGEGIWVYSHASSVAKNNLVFLVSATVDAGVAQAKDFVIGSGTFDYNASEDATAPGANSITGITPANEVTDVNAATFDCTLLRTAECREAGVDLSGEGFSDDVAGYARPQPTISGVWDIGASEYLGKVYTRGDEAALPAADGDLENAFVIQDYLDVSLDDATRVSQSATNPEFSIFLFKDNNIVVPQEVTLTWNGQSSLAPSTTPVYLQVYNRNSTTWEAVDDNSIAGANTDFTLTGSISTNLSNYFDANGFIACRVYQDAG
jgi:hypothetical protein